MTEKEVQKLSEENFQKLLDIYNADEKMCLPFLGAGISTPTGIDSWKKLLMNMAINLCKTIKSDDVENIIEQYGYPRTASLLKEDINDEVEYKNFLIKQFEPTNILTTSAIIKIVIKFHSIVTTNYDTTIEEAIKTINYIYKDKGIEKLDYEFQDLPVLSSIKLLRKKNIVYLHGYKKNETFLLTEEDYKLFYPSNYSSEGIESLENFLKEIIENMTLVFIGFSFNDKDFCDFFKRTKDKIESQKRLINMNFKNHKEDKFNHFAFIKFNNEKYDELEKILNDLGIKAIYYFDKYANLEEYLHKLEKTKVVKKEEEYPSV
jgi:hypothetical protein